jgi:hypothetical protein
MFPQWSKENDVKTNMSAQLQVPYGMNRAPGIKGNVTTAYSPSSGRGNKVDFTTQFQGEAGYSPQYGANMNLMAFPYISGSNVPETRWRDDKYYEGAIRAGIGPQLGMSYGIKNKEVQGENNINPGGGGLQYGARGFVEYSPTDWLKLKLEAQGMFDPVTTSVKDNVTSPSVNFSPGVNLSATMPLNYIKRKIDKINPKDQTKINNDQFFVKSGHHRPRFKDGGLVKAQEGLQQPIIDKAQDEAETFAYAKAADKERWKELMDKSKAIMDTAQGRKLWYQDLKPKNFSIDELQKFTKGVKEYNQGAQDYERARRKVQEGKIPTSDFARMYDEKGWGKYDQATMKEGYKGQFQDAADEAQKRKEANMGVTDAVLELTGAPALSRIIQDPMGTLKGVGNTAADIAMSAAPGFGAAFGAGDSNVNPLTGNQYWSGLDKTLDVVGVLPGIGSLGKLGKVGKFGKVGSYAEDVLGASKKITSAPKNMNIKLLPDNIRSKELDMETFGVYKGDTKVGEVSGNRLSSGDFETLDIGVDPKFQRQGIGTEVYKQLNQSLPEGNKVRSWGAFVENNGVAPGRNTWQSLERQGLAKQNEKGIYEMLPNINETVDLWRIQEKGARPMAELATEGKLGKHFQNEKAIKHFKDREEHFGQWFTKDKNDFDFYKTDREFIDPEVIKLQVPKSKLESFSNYNKSLSRAPDREFVVPKDQQELYRTQYKKGGYIDAELTPEEIAWYRSQGYQVEDMD